MSESLVAALERNALKFGERLAVSYPAGNVTLTWEELHRRSVKLAQHLNEQGINKGNTGWEDVVCQQRE
jgi:acyl-CoA synthetase (AMP-forming)/AMP-acid ligase II